MVKSPSSVFRVLRPYLLIAPAYAVIGVVLIYPTLYNLYLSLWDWRYTAPQKATFVGLANYAKLVRDPVFWDATVFSLSFVVLTIALECLLGLATALLLYGVLRGRRILTSLTLLPHMIAPLAVGLVWHLLWARDFGLVNYLLGLLRIPPVSWLGEPGTALVAVVIPEVWRSTPFVTMILLAALTAMPAEVFEAAHTDGASRWQLFRRITLPLLVPALTVALLFQTIFKLRVFDLVYILTGGGPGTSTMPYGLLVYRTYFRYLAGGASAALAVVLLFLGAAISALYLTLVYREVEQ